MTAREAARDRPFLVVDDLLREAQQATGLSDYGDMWFVAPLTRLVSFINEEAGLLSAESPAVNVVKGLLRDRLHLVDFVKKHPAVRDEKIDVAGVVVGLPRGGSTLLQRLLCSSPQLTAPYYWEMMSPFPLPGEKPGDPSPRIQQAQAILDNMDKVWPGSTGIHPMHAAVYDEESFLITRSFMSVDFIFYFHLPGYVRWLRAQDQTKAYEELRLWLQVLQYQDPSRRKLRWLLKTGHYLWCAGLPYILRTFPGAKALMTHRSLERVIPSVCSLQSTFIAGHTRDFDPAWLGPEAMDLYADGLADLIAVRKAQPERFVDIPYADLIADPRAQFRRALTAMGMTVGPADEEAASQWLKDSSDDGHPQHAYKPEDFGVTPEQIRARFKFYSDQFVA
jgi:hypothetical protein